MWRVLVGLATAVLETAAFLLAVRVADGAVVMAAVALGAAVIGELTQSGMLGSWWSVGSPSVLADLVITLVGWLLFGGLGGWVLGKACGSLARALTWEADGRVATFVFRRE